jgi:hypothetical protein
VGSGGGSEDQHKSEANPTKAHTFEGHLSRVIVLKYQKYYYFFNFFDIIIKNRIRHVWSLTPQFLTFDPLKELGHKSNMKVVRKHLILLNLHRKCRFLPQTKRLQANNN